MTDLLPQESPQLYRQLNYTMYTPGAETDEKLKEYRDYIKHTTAAANCLPNYVGRMPWACAVGLRP